MVERSRTPADFLLLIRLVLASPLATLRVGYAASSRACAIGAATVQQNLLLGARITTVRSRKSPAKHHFALLAQLVEHFHGKEGVDGSSPSEGFRGFANDGTADVAALRGDLTRSLNDAHAAASDEAQLAPPIRALSKAAARLARALERRDGHLHGSSGRPARIECLLVGLSLARWFARQRSTALSREGFAPSQATTGIESMCARNTYGWLLTVPGLVRLVGEFCHASVRTG